MFSSEDIAMIIGNTCEDTSHAYTTLICGGMMERADVISFAPERLHSTLANEKLDHFQMYAICLSIQNTGNYNNCPALFTRYLAGEQLTYLELIALLGELDLEVTDNHDQNEWSLYTNYISKALK